MIMLTRSEEVDLIKRYGSFELDEQQDVQPDWVSRKFPSTGRVCRVVEANGTVIIKQIVNDMTKQTDIHMTMRLLFEEKVYPSFSWSKHGLRQKKSGEYVSDILEDHWQTFQEGFEMGMLHVEKMIDERTN